MKYYDYDSSFSQRSNYYRALGGSGTYTGSASQNTWLLSKFRSIKGYSKDGIVDNLQKVIQGNGDDSLTINTLKRGEGILDPSMTQQWLKLVNTLPELNSIIDLAKSPLQSSISIDTIDIAITLPNVKDYSQLKAELVNDKQFNNYISTLIQTGLIKGNSLSKYKFK